MDPISIGKVIRMWTDYRQIGPAAIPGVVILDQLSHIRATVVTADEEAALRKHHPTFPLPPGPRRPDHERWEWLIDMLQWMAKKYNLLIVALHQLNTRRDEVDDKPTLESLRSSQGIGHKSDAVVILWRPKRVPNPLYKTCKSEPKTVPNEFNRTWLLGPKVRAAPEFEFEVRWDPARQRYTDPTDLSQTLTLPEPPSPKALEAQTKLAALRREHEQLRDAAAVPMLPATPAPEPAPDVELPAAADDEVTEAREPVWPKSWSTPPADAPDW